MAATDFTKTAVYDSLSVINRATDQITEQIERLKTAYRLTYKRADLFRFSAEELRAQLNHVIIGHLSRDEGTDAARFQKRRMEQEKKIAED
ncbi:MAG: hypothetical protein LAP21_04990 [Acidobacteriia bacterium]|nr:hypothetical protein [Terriglobia bacterium]